jgi:hypothetical protein
MSVESSPAPQIEPAQQAILMRLGELIVKWNACENLLRTLLIYAAGNTDRSNILTAHMGTTEVCDALKTMANEFAPPEINEHIPYLITFFERIREYRNYYVHGISGFMTKQDDQTIKGYTQQRVARTRLTVYADFIGEDDLKAVLGYLDGFTKYINPILVPLLWPKGAPPEVKVVPISSLEKPRLPDKLQKRPLFPLDEQRQPPTS